MGKASTKTETSASEEAAVELHAQALYALERELAVSANLRETRKTLSAVLAIVLGIGFFRVDFHRRPDEISVVSDSALWVIRGLFTLAMVGFLPGLYYLFTERPVKGERERLAGSGSSLSELHFPENLMPTLGRASRAQLLSLRTKSLRLAYERLVEANHRVRRRIYTGLYWLFGSVLLVMLGFVIYFWSLQASSAVQQKASSTWQQQR